MATTDAAVFADSKLRRETSNFKISFTPANYIPDPNSKNPTEPIQGLLQILPKNLGPEDFIGLVWRTQQNGRVFFTANMRVEFAGDAWDIGGNTFYIPSTGYLVDDKYGTSDSEGGEGGDDKGSGGVGK